MEHKHHHHKDAKLDNKEKESAKKETNGPIQGIAVHPTDQAVVNPDEHALSVQRKRSIDIGDKNKKIAAAVKTIIECLGSAILCCCNFWRL